MATTTARHGDDYGDDDVDDSNDDGNDDSNEEIDDATTTALKKLNTGCENRPKRFGNSENDPKKIRKRPRMEANPVAQVRKL